jgi:hypothetical protein
LAFTTIAALALLVLAGILGAPHRWRTTPVGRLRMGAAIALLVIALALMAKTMIAYW